MEHDRRLSLTVGGLVLVSLGALALAILSLSAEQGVWRDRYRLKAHFDNVQGLIDGSPVWLAGKRVGRVESVRFGELGGQRSVEVILQVDRDVAPRIRTDSVATVGTIGLLGDRYVEVSMGTLAGTPLQAGDELQTLSPVDYNVVIAKGASALDSITDLVDNVNHTVESFAKGRGGEQLAASVGAIGDMMKQIQSGDGLLHSLIYDQYEGGGVESIGRSLATLESILHEIRHGDGLLHSVIYDSPGEEAFLHQLSSAGTSLESILAKVDQGDGTLGLLLNDPTLFEELKQLVGGAGRSTVVRSVIRMVTDSP